MRIIIIAIAMFAMAGMVFAGTQIETHLSCTGNCSINITQNGKNISVSSNETLELESNSSENGTVLSVNATGAGSVAAIGYGNTSVMVVTDDKDKKTESNGFFEMVFSFFRQIKLFAWFGN